MEYISWQCIESDIFGKMYWRIKAQDGAEIIMNKREIYTRILMVVVLIAFTILMCVFLYKNKDIQNLGTNAKNDISVINIYAMDTYMKISIPKKGDKVDKALEMARDRILELDRMLSTENPDSEVYSLNANGGGMVSEDVYELLETSIDAYEMTDGAFDITIYPVMELWGFDSDNKHVPDSKELDAVLKRVGSDRLQVYADSETDNSDLDGTNNELSKYVKNEAGAEKVGEYKVCDKKIMLTMPDDDTQLDFGGIAKGYAAAEIVKILKASGIDNAIINLGGNVYGLGHRADGKPWKVAVRTPEDANEVLCTIEVSDEEVVTSGGYQRFFEEDGVKYHHIIDPKTGYPANSGLESVTVITKDAALGDALSTAIFVMGKDRGIELWRRYSDVFDVVMLTSTGELIATEGLEGRVTPDCDLSYVN